MRSPQEISFRLRQELANAWLFLRQPSLPVTVDVQRSLTLPEVPAIAASLRARQTGKDLQQLADSILAGHLPLLGIEYTFTAEDINWREDWINHRQSSAKYFRLIPYLDFDRVGDHKLIWELNRHQYLVTLAQASIISGNNRYSDAVFRHIDSWLAANPFQQGINWCSALEVAFRGLSWMWIFHLCGSRMETGFKKKFLTALWQHGLHLKSNLSIYFSPNTHLLGEAVTLHALGTLFPEFPGSPQWRQTGEHIVRQQIERQVLPDGAYFEQSVYYHIYALDFIILHYLLAGRPPEILAVIERMASYLSAVVGPTRINPLIGDDDGGRLFHPFGSHEGYAKATLATCGVLTGRADWVSDPADLDLQAVWWLGAKSVAEPASRTRKPTAATSVLFRDSGTAVMSAGDLQAIVDVGPFGPFRAGHSHSDTLSLVLRRGAEALLIDPGTFAYMDSNGWRNRFRGSGAHNTLRVDHLDQAPTLGPFAWSGKPEVAILCWESQTEADFLDARCRYAGSPFSHRRRILFLKPDRLFILDQIEGEGIHRIEQFWHPGQDGAEFDGGHTVRLGSGMSLYLDASLVISSSPGGEFGWQSKAYGRKTESLVVTGTIDAELTMTLGSAILPSRDALASDGVSVGKAGHEFHLSLAGEVCAVFNDEGKPNLRAI